MVKTRIFASQQSRFSFRHVQEDDDAEISQDSVLVSTPSEQTSHVTPECAVEGARVTETQDADVRWFMERFRVNSGIIELLNQYLIALANKSEQIW